jgi:acyl transferase domain-containing protein
MSNIEATDHPDDIAIIGIAGRFPKTKGIDEFWLGLREGVELISPVTDRELDSSGIDAAVRNSPNYVRASAILEDVDLFDASFFGMNPREAEVMDPQHRVFLECAWQAIEMAGYGSEGDLGSVGVYAGASTNNYWMNIYSCPGISRVLTPFQISLVNDKDHLPTRISYKLNLKGPSVNVQTACSTSLVAVHMACRSLLDGECDMALAGGVSISSFKKAGYFYEEGGICSPDGHCRAFDARARGTVGGNGIGIVVLRRLNDAIASGDYIHAVIKGSAVNNDGSLKVGYTAPSIEGQAQVIAEAMAVARVEPDTISYVEAHGTGTALGDPIEIAALTQVFRARTNKKQFCAIGSVKTNVGHLDAAAGVTGLIKTVLALKNEMLPPSLHFESPNPKINFEESPFYVNGRLTAWPRSDSPRRAGVSSFGIGGTNAHLVVEEAPVVEPSGPGRHWQLLAISAKTSTALEQATRNLHEHLKQHSSSNLADIAYTYQVGRRRFPHRRVIVCRDVDDAITALETPSHERILTESRELRNRPVIFMFPGQGSQYVNMGVELYESEKGFRSRIDKCAVLLKPQLGHDVRQFLYPGRESPVDAAERLKQTAIAQAALFAIEYSLAMQWLEWGVKPRAMIGHSIGEYVAACVAGVLSLENALRLVASRGQLMQTLPEGAMLAVSLSAVEMRFRLGPQLSLAAINSPARCVVSGRADRIDELARHLSDEGIACSRLHTSHAFHSEMMEPIMRSFTEQVRKLDLNRPRIPYISNVTGTWITGEEATKPDYWTTHLRQTVRFAEGIAELMKEPDGVFLEVGPGGALSTLVLQQRPNEQSAISSLNQVRGRGSDVQNLLKALGRLWLAGVEVDWLAFYAGQRRQRLPLPTYPFERQRYWLRRSDNGGLTFGDGAHPIGDRGSQSPEREQEEAVPSNDELKPNQCASSQRSDAPPICVVDADRPNSGMVDSEEDQFSDDHTLQQILRQQLEIMSLQLCFLREDGRSNS